MMNLPLSVSLEYCVNMMCLLGRVVMIFVGNIWLEGDIGLMNIPLSIFLEYLVNLMRLMGRLVVIYGKTSGLKGISDSISFT